MLQLTDEQKNIIQAEGNLKINAVAGSGKTTTLVEYAKKRPFRERILYLAFNKSVKNEAIQKFGKAQVENVSVETAHSLAFGYTMRGTRYQLSPYGYRSYDVKEMLQIQRIGNELNSEYILANHVLKYCQYFCNQATANVQDLNYLALYEPDTEVYKFVKSHYDTIQHLTRLLLNKMQQAEIAVTHDFYLKKFQLLQPRLPYDYILFDEGQDASPVMLDIFLNQEQATKVIVGDVNQQIYAWRYAINALQKVDFQQFNLTNSFRFSQEIADLAMYFLGWKKHITHYEPVKIIGAGSSPQLETRATIARRNITLLQKAIEAVSGENSLKRIYFEGNFSSYTYSGESASIYDVLNLYLNKKALIRDKLIKLMPTFADLEEYAEKVEDTELLMLIEIVRTYRDALPYWLNQLKERQVPDNERLNAEMIFSTVHKCKGMEYDIVFLANDFIEEADIYKQLFEKPLTQALINRIIEEINILYVACTRTRKQLYIPTQYLPENQANQRMIDVFTLVENAKNKKDTQDLIF